MESIKGILEKINTSTSSQKEKLVEYKNLIEKIFNNAAISSLENSGKQALILSSQVQEFFSHIVQENVVLSISRQVIQQLVDSIDKCQTVQFEIKKNLWETAAKYLKTRLVAFEEQASIVYERLSALLEEEEEWTAAAKVLMEIPLDSGYRNTSDDYKIRIYVHIVRLLLEDQDPITAEAYLNRAALLMPNPQTDESTQLQYRLSHVRILDYKRQFLAASAQYHELSYDGDIVEGDRLRCLEQAIICAVLGNAGPIRSRLLSTLFKDERVRDGLVNSVLHVMLEKMYLERVIRKPEVEEFAKLLQSHHLALLSDGHTVLDHAVMEHNILSASKIYHNISFEEMGSILGISADQAEDIVTKMIGEDRLKGTIDQLDQIIQFSSAQEIPVWHERIAGLCYQAEGLMTAIVKEYPEWVQNNFT